MGRLTRIKPPPIPTHVFRYDGNRDRKDLILWEGDACGAPRVVPKKLGKKPPYNHSTDERIYRPVVPLSNHQLTTLVPAKKVRESEGARNEGNERSELPDAPLYNR